MKKTLPLLMFMAIGLGLLCDTVLHPQTFDSSPRGLAIVLFANLGTPANGTVVYCSNCTTTNPTTGSGSGSLVRREAGAWNGGGGTGGSAATPLATGTSLTLTAPRGYAVCTGTCTVSVPVPAAGYEFCVLNDDNVATAITLSAIGSAARYENTDRTAYGTAGTGTFVASATAGNKVCLVGRDSTHYLTVSYIGVWTAN